MRAVILMEFDERVEMVNILRLFSCPSSVFFPAEQSSKL